MSCVFISHNYQNRNHSCVIRLCFCVPCLVLHRGSKLSCMQCTTESVLMNTIWSMLLTYWNASFFGAPRVRKTEHLYDSTPTFCHVAFAKICPVVENVFCTEDAHRTFSRPHTLNWQLQNWRDSRLKILATRQLNLDLVLQIKRKLCSFEWKEAIQTATERVNVKPR